MSEVASTASCQVRSHFISPPAEFDGCFTTFYRLELDIADGATVWDHLQPEWANIRFFAGGCPISQLPGGPALSGARFTATGPSSLPNRFELGSSQMWGIGFLPLGWARYFDVDAASVTNVVVDGSKHPCFIKFAPLCEVLCDAGRSHEEQLEAIYAMMRELSRPNRDEEKILRVHRALVDPEVTNVADFAERSGKTVRSLERVCLRYFGFAPKLLLRRQRFMRSLTSFMLHRGSKWTEAMDEHYHDQAQFTREFQQFMVMKPTDYAALDHPILSSFMEQRARIWGSAAQTLDAPD
ncbi:MAG: AraC family transcriptional regulator [Erythrobacter sp.]|nr:AraC family transcriptional regulator [Erythrobacter sp.]